MKALPPAQLPEVVVLARRHARASGLIYVTDEEPGIKRERAGAGFRYVASNGRPVRSERTLLRIRSLAIPPAYTKVWICREPRGHLQATGRDARGRKQYRYHPKWRETRDEGKFSRMVEFGARLPPLRRRLRQDLAASGLPKHKVLAAIVKLLDETLIRVGNEEYARANRSYGLTTLRDKHLKVLRDGRASLSFRGKSGRQHDVVLNDRRLARILRNVQALPGQQLFQYVDDEDRRQPIDSGMVNDYLREAMDAEGEGFTAKDFRTWGGTLRAMAFLSCQAREEAMSKRAFNACVACTARHVAEALGNTAAVCRKAYINPIVFEAWRCGALDAVGSRAALSPKQMEKIALAVLRKQGRKAKAARKAPSKKARKVLRVAVRRPPLSSIDKAARPSAAV